MLCEVHNGGSPSSTFCELVVGGAEVEQKTRETQSADLAYAGRFQALLASVKGNTISRTLSKREITAAQVGNRKTLLCAIPAEHVKPVSLRTRALSLATTTDPKARRQRGLLLSEA